jgi:hypothetical protein
MLLPPGVLVVLHCDNPCTGNPSVNIHVLDCCWLGISGVEMAAIVRTFGAPRKKKKKNEEEDTSLRA